MLTPIALVSLCQSPEITHVLSSSPKDRWEKNKLYHKAELERSSCPYYSLGKVEDAFACSGGWEEHKDLERECLTYVQISSKRREPRQTRKRLLLSMLERSLQFLAHVCFSPANNHTLHIPMRSTHQAPSLDGPKRETYHLWKQGLISPPPINLGGSISRWKKIEAQYLRLFKDEAIKGRSKTNCFIQMERLQRNISFWTLVLWATSPPI